MLDAVGEQSPHSPAPNASEAAALSTPTRDAMTTNAAGQLPNPWPVERCSTNKGGYAISPSESATVGSVLVQAVAASADSSSLA